MPADAFRPRTTSELLDASIQMLRKHYASFLMLSVIGLLPQIAVSAYNITTLVPQYAQGSFAYSLPLFGVALLVLAIADAAIVRAASDAYLGEPVEPGAALRQSIGRAGTIVLATIVKYLLIAVGYVVVLLGAGILAAILLAIIWGIMAAAGHGLGGVNSPAFTITAGIIVGVVLGLAALTWLIASAARLFGYRAAIMLEGCGTDASLRRSNTLARGHVWKVVGTFVLVYIIYAAVYALFYAIALLASRRPVVAQTASGIAGMLIYPMIPIVTTLLYYDLRMRKEGYDIELMAGELEGRRAVSSEL